MKSTSLFILIISLAFGKVECQEYFRLYQHLLPLSEKFNTSLVEAIDYNIQNYASLDPDLIYYYIAHINNTYRISKEKKPATYSWLKALKTKALIKKNTWIQKEIVYADQHLSDYKQEPVEYYLEGLISEKPDPEDTLNVTIDVGEKNKIKFYTYIFFAKKEKLFFDPQTNYEALCQLEFKKKIYEIESFYKNYTETTKENQLSAAEMISENPFLFKDSYLNGYPNTTHFPAFAFIGRYINDQFNIPDKIYFSITENLERFVYKSAEFEYLRATMANFRTIRVQSAVNTEFALGYKMQTKRVPVALSWIDISIGFSTFYTLHNDRDGEELFSNDTFIPGVGTLYGKFLIKNTTSSAKAYRLKLAVPAYIIIPEKMSIEAGLNYSYLDMSWKIKTEVEGEFIYRGPFPYIIKTQYSEKASIVSAAANFSYDLSNLNTIKASVLIPFYNSNKTLDTFIFYSIGLDFNFSI